MADFSKYSNHKDGTGVSGVVFGAGSTVLEVELNEMQEIQKYMLRSIIKNAMGNGITDIDKLVYQDGSVKILNGCYLIADGYCINCSNIRHTMTDGTVYVQIWEETVNSDAVLNVNGYVNSTESVENWIRDPRSLEETTRRRVIKYQMSSSQDNSKINIPIAKVSNGIMTKLVKEVNFDKLFNRVDSMDEYDMQDTYGVEVDFESNTIRRIGGSVGRNGGADFDNINAFKRRRCLVALDGSVLAYYGDANYYNNTSGLTTKAMTALNGTSVPVGTYVNTMVEQNKFYYKVVPVKVDKINDSKDSGYYTRKVRYYISDTYKPGFKVHPAFIKITKSNQVLEFDKIYIGAYKSVAFNSDKVMVNDTAYANGTLLDFTKSGRMASVSGKIPLSGQYYDMNMSNIRRLLYHMHNNGFYRMKDITVMSMDILLFLIEYATFNAQNVLGKGWVDGTGANISGVTDSLGNASSSTTDALNGISYRGEENIFGNLSEYIEGFKIENSVPKWSNMLHPYEFTPVYNNTNIHLDLNMRGYISAFGYDYNNDWMFIPVEGSGGQAVPVGDVVTTNTYSSELGVGVATYGGSWNYGSNAGICNFALGIDARGAHYGSRMVFFPESLSTDIG